MATADMRPEDQLIICCARLRLTPKVAQCLGRLVQKEIDWSYVLNTAARHGLIPLLYRHLNATCPENIPEAVLKLLRDRIHANAAWNLLLTSELRNILSIFEAKGIPAVPFKGPALAALVYGDLSLRQFGDLDLLVRREDVPKAKEVLIAKGYRPDISLTAAQNKAYLRSYYHYGFFHEAKRVLLELHWEITRWFLSFPLDSEGLWQRLERRSLAGRQVFNFTPEDLLLIICVHSAVHCWQRLAWVCDAAALLDLPQGIDWEKVLKVAGPLGAERMVFLGLFLAKEISGASLPEDIWQRVQADRVVKSLARQAQEGFFRAGKPSKFWGETRFHLRVRRGLWDKARYCFHATFSPSDEDLAFCPLPAGLFPLYYLLRPIRLTGKHLLRLKSLQKS